MLMRHDVNGWHNASGPEIEDMKKNGWIESSYEEYKKVIDAKKAPKHEEPVIIEAQDATVKGKPGRKPKLSLGGIYGDNSDKD